jgi:hypothetical protein
MKDYEAFEEHMIDHWKEQGFIEADTAPSGKVIEGQGHWHYMDGVNGLPRSITPIRYQIENMNTREVRIFKTYQEAKSDFDKLSENGCAHGCWRIISLIEESIK